VRVLDIVESGCNPCEQKLKVNKSVCKLFRFHFPIFYFFKMFMFLYMLTDLAFIAAFSKFTLFQNQSIVAVASWVATIPVSMGLSAFIYWIIAKILLG